jgi:hypothetical protein
VEVIADNRGWSVQHVVQMALIKLATVEEAEQAGLVE